MANRTKLEYPEYKALEGKLVPRSFHEVREETVDGTAYRKTIVVVLCERELRYVGPWKHDLIDYIAMDPHGEAELA